LLWKGHLKLSIICRFFIVHSAWILHLADKCETAGRVFRTLVYAEKCPIRMRMEMGLKMGSTSILMRTESAKFWRRPNPFWVHKWPVAMSDPQQLNNWPTSKRFATKFHNLAGGPLLLSIYLSPFM
jgi:hypothetical protein